ncbi:conjugal transfer protein [Oenococcus kitaharae]|uniref:conjugal transfer protein TrbL family protein n=1 Tax=Oenococcus kitaharae TaxID=336988 RepID=UPI0008631095|nr:conjugal transfer protein TrbL family protein [Oenococcus kitaharae]OEY83861.1 conjugal transfer protein [Oenococcus kitaharae]
MTDIIQSAITHFFEWLLSGLLDGLFNICQAIIDQANQSLPIIQTWYAIFLSFATSLVVVVVLGRIIITMIKETDESTDVTWANIVMDGLKSAAVIPVFVFLQGFIQGSITLPLLRYMFGSDQVFTSKSITGMNQIPGLASVGVSLPLQILFLLIFTIVTVVFFIKMCIFVADMAWYNLTIPLAAMSMATESFDYSGTWWKKYIYYNASIISQVLCMSLSVWSFTHMAQYGFMAFIAAIGFGFLVVKTPDAVKDFWASTGVTRSAGMGAMRMLQSYLRKS